MQAVCSTRAEVVAKGRIEHRVFSVFYKDRVCGVHGTVQGKNIQDQVLQRVQGEDFGPCGLAVR